MPVCVGLFVQDDFDGKGGAIYNEGYIAVNADSRLANNYANVSEQKRETAALQCIVVGLCCFSCLW